MLQILTDIQRKLISGRRTKKPEGSKNSARMRNMFSSGSSDTKGSTGGLSSSYHGEKKKRRYKNSSRDEFKKEIPPTFNGEIKTGQEVES